METGALPHGPALITEPYRNAESNCTDFVPRLCKTERNRAAVKAILFYSTFIAGPLFASLALPQEGAL